jgi:hypothetical protein
MTAEREIRSPVLGAPGELCSGCGALLAEDQRYCLNCGERRCDPRVPLDDTTQSAEIPVASEPTASRAVLVTLRSTPLSIGAAAAGAGLVLLALLVGVLVGNSGDGGSAPVAAPRPQVITVTSAGGANTAAPAQGFSSDWPNDTTGYTVQLQTLSKDGSDPAAVEAAKADADGNGAADVGALDSDDFESLDAGSYVIYSGVFKSKSAAKKALRDLKADFPGAKVIRVGSGGGSGGSSKGEKKVGKSQLKNLDKLTPQEYQKKSRKLPDKLKLPGKAPSKDNKKPGGGGGVETIG